MSFLIHNTGWQLTGTNSGTGVVGEMIRVGGGRLRIGLNGTNGEAHTLDMGGWGIGGGIGLPLPSSAIIKVVEISRTITTAAINFIGAQDILLSKVYGIGTSSVTWDELSEGPLLIRSIGAAAGLGFSASMILFMRTGWLAYLSVIGPQVVLTPFFVKAFAFSAGFEIGGVDLGGTAYIMHVLTKS
jgi:hypothetical protein